MDNDIVIRNASILDVSRLTKGRLLGSNVHDAVSTKKKEKYIEKADWFSSVAKNDKLLRKSFSVQSAAVQHVQNIYRLKLDSPTIYINQRNPVICAVVGGMYLI